MPRTEAVITCARAGNAAHRTSARTASSEIITRELPDDSFALKNRIFIRLPLEEIFARKESTKSEKKLFASDSFSLSPTTDSRKDPTPKALPDVMLLY